MIALLLLAVTLASAAEPPAVDCRAGPGGGGHWSYRLLDGKKCWYLGNPGKDRRELRWPDQKVRSPVRSSRPVKALDPPVFQPEPEQLPPELLQPKPAPADWPLLSPHPSGALAWAHFANDFAERFPDYIRGPSVSLGKAPPPQPSSWWLWLVPFLFGATFAAVWSYWCRETAVEVLPEIADQTPPWLRAMRGEVWPLEEHEWEERKVLDKYRPKKKGPGV